MAWTPPLQSSAGIACIGMGGAGVGVGVNQFCQRQAADDEARRKALDMRLDARIAEAESRLAASKVAAMSHIHRITTDATVAIVAVCSATHRPTALLRLRSAKP